MGLRSLNFLEERLPKERSKDLAKSLVEVMNGKLESMGLRLVFQYDEFHDDLEHLVLVQLFVEILYVNFLDQ